MLGISGSLGLGSQLQAVPPRKPADALLAPTWQAQQTQSPVHFYGSVEIVYFLLNRKNKIDSQFKENVLIYNNQCICLYINAIVKYNFKYLFVGEEAHKGHNVSLSLCLGSEWDHSSSLRAAGSSSVQCRKHCLGLGPGTQTKCS